MKTPASLLLLVLLFPSLAGAKEPAWREPWQSRLTAWLKTVTEEEVAFQPKAFDWTKLDPAEFHRNRNFFLSYSPVLIATSTMKLPAEAFTWKGLWKEDEETQRILTPYDITKGQMWIPTGPTAADSLALLYSWDRPWNPYHGDKALAMRAAVIGMVDLIMLRENVHFYTSGDAGCRQPPFPPRACESGFSLTFNAYAFWRVRDALPQEAREAWAEGLVWFATYNFESRLGGPENMQLSVPVGIYYVGLALDDDHIKGQALERMREILGKHYDPAGYIRDAGVPDGSYNGISLHRLAEFWGMSRSPEVLEVLRQAYALKLHLVLPEPDGTTLSPSHFNARCKDGFDRDQYNGREVVLLKEVPDAGYFMRSRWHERDMEKQASSFQNLTRRDFSRLGKPGPWASNHRWDAVMDIPHVEYHEPDEAAMEKIMAASGEPMVLRSDRYTRNFGDEFYAVRRPGYAAVFYAGPAVASDSGATNHAGMLKGEGGHLMGFAGGGLSAFWTPETSTLLLGRMTAYETYDRKVRTFDWGSYILSGWRDWLNNHVVGETAEGKVLTSARTPHPESKLSDDGNRLEITGVMPKKLRKQGEVTNVEVAYSRKYEFRDDRIGCELTIRTDQPLEMKSLYEALPVLTSQKNNRGAKEYTGETTWRFLNAAGQPVEPKPVPPPYGDSIFEGGKSLNPITEKEETSARVEGVKTVEFHRYDGVARLVFEKPAALSLTSVEVASTQMTSARGRALLIELPTRIEPNRPVTLRYQLQAVKAAPKTALSPQP